MKHKKISAQNSWEHLVVPLPSLNIHVSDSVLLWNDSEGLQKAQLVWYFLLFFYQFELFSIPEVILSLFTPENKITMHSQCKVIV